MNFEEKYLDAIGLAGYCNGAAFTSNPESRWSFEEMLIAFQGRPK